jgi:hypothetical protein
VEKPKLTLLLFENVTALMLALLAPALIFTLPCVEATVTLAVITELFESPNVTLFELLKLIDERLRLVPAAETTMAWLAVIVPTPAPVESPKVTPLLLPKVTAESAFEVPPPADIFRAKLPVIVPAPAPVDRPKETLLELLNVTADSAAELAPPLTVMLPWLDATVALAVITELLERPKLTLLLLLNVIALRLRLEPPADTNTLVRLEATVAEAVSVPALIPNETLLLLLNTREVCAATLAVTVETFVPNDTPLELLNT